METNRDQKALGREKQARLAGASRELKNRRAKEVRYKKGGAK